MSERKYDPRGCFDVTLNLYADYPADQKPTFTYRRLSAAEWDRLDEERAKLEQLEDAKQFRTRMIELATWGMIDWQKQVDIETGEEVPFDLEKVLENIRRVINHDDALELIAERKDHCSLSFADKKKLELHR